MSLARRLASKSVFVFALRVGGAGAIFLVQAAMARLWGSTVLGDFLLVVAVSNLVSVAMPLGFQTVGNYFAAEYRAKGEGRHLRRFLVRAYGHIVVIGVPLVLFGAPLTRFLGEAGPHLEPIWMPTAILAFCNAVVFVNAAILIGLKRPLAGWAADMLFRPMLVISTFAVAAAAFAGPALWSMLWMLALAYSVVTAFHFGVVLHAARAVPTTETEIRRSEARRWWRFATPWVLITLATDFFFDINLLMLAGLMGRDDLAVFGVCTRIFSLVSFGTVAVYAQTMPDMYEADARADRAGVARKLGEANLVATLLSLGLFAGVAVFGPFALGLFGPGFEAGALPLAILCLSLVMRAIFGPASMVLSMKDRPYASLPAVALGLATLAAGNFALVPTYGLMGAAIAAFIAVTLWSGGLWITALKTSGIDVSLFALVRRPAAVA